MDCKDDDVSEPLTSQTETDDFRLRRPATVALLVVLFAVVAFVPDEAVLRQKAVWARVALLAAAAVSLIEAARTGRRARPWPALIAGLVGLALLAAAHTALSTPTSVRLAWDEVVRLGLYPLGVFAAGTALADPRARRVLGLVVCAVTVPIAAYALGQHLAEVLALPIDRHQRAPATFGNPVFLGAFLVLVLPWCLATAAFDRSRARWLGAVAAGLGLPALFATGSVGSWAAFAGAVAVGVLAAVPSRRLRWRLLGAGLGLAVVVALFGGDEITRPRAHTLIWRDTWAMVGDAPLGIGPGQFHLDFVDHASDELLAVYPPGRHVINDVHSEPLQLLVELGWPGLALAAWALAVALVRGLALVSRRGDDVARRAGPAAVLAGLAGTALLSLTSPDQRFTVSVTTTAVFLGWLAALDPATRARARRLGPAARTACLVAGLAVLGAAAWTAHTRTRPSDLVLPHQVAAVEGKARVSPLHPRQLEVARRARPTTAETQQQIAALLLAHGHFADAADAFRRTIALGADTPDVQRALGVAACSAGHFEAARAPLERALDAWPDDADLHFTLGYVAWRTGDLSDALRHVERALELAPDHAYARLLIEKLRE